MTLENPRPSPRECSEITPVGQKDIAPIFNQRRKVALSVNPVRFCRVEDPEHQNSLVPSLLRTYPGGVVPLPLLGGSPMAGMVTPPTTCVSPVCVISATVP